MIEIIHGHPLGSEPLLDCCVLCAGRVPSAGEQRQVQPVDTDVNHVKVLGALGNRFEQGRLSGGQVWPWAAESKRAWADGNKFRARSGVAAREQRHVMPE